MYKYPIIQIVTQVWPIYQGRMPTHWTQRWAASRGFPWATLRALPWATLRALPWATSWALLFFCTFGSVTFGFLVCSRRLYSLFFFHILIEYHAMLCKTLRHQGMHIASPKPCHTFLMEEVKDFFRFEFPTPLLIVFGIQTPKPDRFGKLSRQLAQALSTEGESLFYWLAIRDRIAIKCPLIFEVTITILTISPTAPRFRFDSPFGKFEIISQELQISLSFLTRKTTDS